MLGLTIVIRESYSLEAKKTLLFYVIVRKFFVPSPLEGASNLCRAVANGDSYNVCVENVPVLGYLRGNAWCKLLNIRMSHV